MQGNDVQSGGVQRMTMFSLGELRPRPSWCAGGSRVMDIRGRRGKGSGRHGPNTTDHGPRKGGGVSIAWRIGKRSRKAKAMVGRDELGGDAVQPSTMSSLHPCGG
jgi:hypothetical protein